VGEPIERGHEVEACERLSAHRSRLVEASAVPEQAGSLASLEKTRLEDELRALASELVRSRRRVISAADRERARIERDLHDGAQQRLVALRVRVAMLEESAAVTGQESLAQELARVGHEVEAAIEQIRELAHGIYPSELHDRGLPAALTALARETPFDIDVHADRGSRFAPDVEAAIYFCCLEAVQNAVKHAGAGVRVDVRLSREADGSLKFVVADDGAGFQPDTLLSETHGITSMRDRLGALGGELTINTSPGAGTTVTGLVPAFFSRPPADRRGDVANRHARAADS
jgi:signal transduction histidine kinase